MTAPPVAGAGSGSGAGGGSGAGPGAGGGSGPGAGTTRKLARQGSANLLGSVITALAGFAVVVIVTHAVGQAEAGAFFAATSLFLIVATVARLGTPTGVVWAIARYRALGQRGRIVPMLRGALWPVVVVSACAGVAMLAIDPSVAGGLLKGATDEHFVTMVRVLALFLPAAAVYDSVVATTRGYGTMRATVLVERVARPTAQLVLVGAAGLTSSAVWMTAAWALPYIPALAVAAVLALRLLRSPPADPARPADPASPADPARPADLRNLGPGAAGGWPKFRRSAGGGPGEPPQQSPAREFWGFTAPRSLATVAQIVSQRLDIVLLGALRGPVEAAIYTAATRFLVVGQTAGLALSISAQPMLGTQLARGQTDEANRVYRTATAWLVVVTWPLYLVMLIAAPLLLSVFGRGYDAGLPVVALLAGAMLVATACGMVDMVLTMAGRTAWNLIDMALALAVQVGLDLLLIPDHGIRGAAYGWAGAIVVKNVVALAQVWYGLGMHPFGRATLLAGALSLGCFGALPAAARLVLGDGTPGMLTALVVASAAYAVALWRLRAPLALDELPLLRRGLKRGLG